MYKKGIAITIFAIFALSGVVYAQYPGTGNVPPPWGPDEPGYGVSDFYHEEKFDRQPAFDWFDRDQEQPRGYQPYQEREPRGYQQYDQRYGQQYTRPDQRQFDRPYGDNPNWYLENQYRGGRFDQNPDRNDWFYDYYTPGTAGFWNY